MFLASKESNKGPQIWVKDNKFITVVVVVVQRFQ
jgi:hypothetical protein